MDIKKFESELRDILEQAQLGEIEKAIDRACSGGKNHEALSKSVSNIIYPLFNQATEERIRELTIKYLDDSNECGEDADQHAKKVIMHGSQW